jgi:predicted ATPase
MNKGRTYEQAVQHQTGGQSIIIDGREIDSVTDSALIQAKNSQAAIIKLKNFLSQKVRSQIQETIKMAQQLNKRAEFWFKAEPHLEVFKYIEEKGGIVIVWNNL